MHHDIQSILFTEDQIRGRIAELGREIAREYQGDQLLLMALLKGGVVFISDLMRQIPMPLGIDFIQTSSYGAGTVSKGTVDLKIFPDADLRGKRLLVLDDILDTGRTLKFIVDRLTGAGAVDVRTCVLLDKKVRRQVDLQADHVGFAVDDHFVVGYGLDFNDRYRNLPFIGVLKEECYRAPG